MPKSFVVLSDNNHNKIFTIRHTKTVKSKEFDQLVLHIGWNVRKLTSFIIILIITLNKITYVYHTVYLYLTGEGEPRKKISLTIFSHSF